MLIEYQIAKEKIALKAALKFQKVVILYDRGIPDCRAYMSDLEYKQALQENDLNEIQALNRNEVDLESIRLIDDKTQQAYANRPHLYIIDNSTDFNRKINRLYEQVCSILGCGNPS